MSKFIRLDDECIEQIRKEFNEALMKAKLSDGRIYYTKTFANTNRKATVYYTHEAWAKQQALIKEFSEEVAWHGVAYRGDDSGADEYFITDIMVYPQQVTSATVTTDQQKYEMWLMGLEDDVFSNTRMQGHSHVNMGVTPSGVDNALYDRILDQLEDDMFYIFLIYNKRGDKTYKIYDMAKNVLFETADVTVKVLEDDDEIEGVEITGVTDEEKEAMLAFLGAERLKDTMKEFVDDAKTMVTHKPFAVSTYQKPAAPATVGHTTTQAKPATTQALPPKQPPAPAPANGSGIFPAKSKDKKKKKGKRKEKERMKSAPFGGYCGSLYDDDDDGYYYGTSPYSPFGYT